ncbi:MAG: diguanylate cyclase [Sulfobacillus thermosulfidooxidans]|uniref:Diguanylate cyclase n=1 Tax=Sulfobacillus thermosulfidooxidans TaxID=28034 RepID=A0A2T2WTI2_SULTH|nr:MAG: diguanylate cyclase [Sulfobacillus thermosulfidooxidans]
MTFYVFKRISQSLILLFLVSVTSFFLMHLAPGGPLAVYARNPHITAHTLHVMEIRLGLNLPIWQQYVRWINAWLHGQWGYSISSGLPVVAIITSHLGATGSLMLGGIIVASVLGISIGTIGAVKRNTVFDYISSFFAYMVWAMPVFWLGYVLQLIFGIDLGWLPIAGQSNFSNPSLKSFVVHLILPSLTLGGVSAAGWSRYLRSSLVDVLHQDYIRTAKAKGLPPRRILLKHALRNAIIPLLTIIALDIPFFFSGAVLTEIVFSWPGVGRLFFDALQSQDYPVEISVIMLTAMLIVLCNLAADLLYAVMDPRIQYEK